MLSSVEWIRQSAAISRNLFDLHINPPVPSDVAEKSLISEWCSLLPSDALFLAVVPRSPGTSAAHPAREFAYVASKNSSSSHGPFCKEFLELMCLQRVTP